MGKAHPQFRQHLVGGSSFRLAGTDLGDPTDDLFPPRSLCPSSSGSSVPSRKWASSARSGTDRAPSCDFANSTVSLMISSSVATAVIVPSAPGLVRRIAYHER
ncbi:MAG: hypothetical protein U0736_15910 [Gemmataceae bacterium]